MILEAINHFVAIPLWSLLIGALIGAASGAAVSWWFARQSSKELRQQVRVLARLIQLAGEGVKPGFKVDDKGNVSPVITETLTESLHATDELISAELTTVLPSQSDRAG